jgi:glyoxylase-like metal-dependent hydrolase (beta-lactamase superfamily II)
MVRAVIDLAVTEGIHRIDDAFVNWYLVEDGGAVTVVDAGLPASWSSLQRALAAIGRAPGDIAGILLTHGHADHVGFAERARVELGVDVWVHADDVRQAASPMKYKHEASPLPYLLRRPWLNKVPLRMGLAGALRSRGVTDPRTFAHAGPLDLPGGPVAVPTPGHTAGHCSYFFPDRDALISGDALVTWNPYTGHRGPGLMARASNADSAQALASLDAIAATGAGLILPGHGEPWRGAAADAASQARERGAA